jgi:hypothetical protein
VGYGQINVGEYGLLLLDDRDWSIADCKEFEAGNDTLFRFRKKQKNERELKGRINNESI